MNVPEEPGSEEQIYALEKAKEAGNPIGAPALNHRVAERRARQIL